MKYPFIVTVHRKCTPAEFITFWHPLYAYSNEDSLYTSRIKKEKFTANDIRRLFEWKNGMKVNGHSQKEKSIKHVTKRLRFVNSLKQSYNSELFQKNFGTMAAIWQIFLMHIISPRYFPIFDQHVYRAFFYLKEGEVGEIPMANSQKILVYEEYRQYVKNEFGGCKKARRQVDQALWAFGKFLKTNHARHSLGLPLV